MRDSMHRGSSPSIAAVSLIRTRVGGTRVVDMLTGEQLPRIC